MNVLLRRHYSGLRRQAAGVDAILTTWVAHKPTSKALQRLEARCAVYERERLVVLEQWLAAMDRLGGALCGRDDELDDVEEVGARADTAVAHLRRRKSFLRITLDQFEDDAPSIVLDQIVAGEGLVPALPVLSGQSLRLRHTPQRDFGFRPHYVELSLELSDGHRNYSDYQVQLRLVGPTYELPIGESMLASRFHRADGSRVLVPLPSPVIVGVLEHIEVVIRNRGTTSALVGAFVGVGLCASRAALGERP